MAAKKERTPDRAIGDGAKAKRRAGDVPAANLKDRRRRQHAERIERRKTAKMRDKAIAAWIRATGGTPTKERVANFARNLNF